ncbi:MAG: glycoside hydrolase family 88 protein [Akkermansiaceae bacterium]|nr:glycoside hydrolase family 88 protein [Akkermansiaceae bacterium]
MKTLFLLFAVSCLPLSASAPPLETARGHTPLEWSRKLADSEMKRLGDSLFYDKNEKARWTYDRTLFGLALLKLADATGETKYADFGARTAESFIGKDGSIADYKLEDYNIDLVAPGKVLLFRWEKGKRDDAARTALATLRRQMDTHPRTSEGGFWHKKKYPHQMWLDGLFMASPFLAQYGRDFDEPALFDEVAKQIVLMDKHAFDPKTGLHFHGWDEKRQQDWADKQTGLSENFWGRAIGWYAMALVDTLEFLPPDHPGVPKVRAILRKVADGIVRWQDPETGLWWQVVNEGGRDGNYLEATASSMYVYSLAKAVRNGWLPEEKYLRTSAKGYEGIVRDLIRDDGNGRVDLTNCCEVAGLGFTNSAGKPRDGSFGYYVSEPIIDNDHKGVGPFLMAGIEFTKLGAKNDTGAVGWDQLDRILARIKAPEFPDRSAEITRFGAKPGADCTASIQKAIDECSKAGGGKVVVPAGEWLTGALRLKSNVNLHVSEGATLRWIFDTDLYPTVFTRWEGTECMNFSPLIYAHGEKNIAITGKGTLDGGATAETWWAWNLKEGKNKGRQVADRDQLVEMGAKGVPVEQRVFGKGHYLRPNFIQPYRCENILIEGVTIIRSPMWEIHPVLSRNITVRGVTITSHGSNNDGCNPESCSDVLIEDTLFDTGDDCIAIKSGRNNDGRRVGVPSQNIVIRNCVMKDGHGGVVLGSECSGGIRNVFVENCRMDSPELDRALRFKNNAVRGGVLENVFMRNVKIGRVGEAVLTIDLLYEEGPDGDHMPVVRNVRMENITSSASPRVMFIRGFEGAVIDGIGIRNSSFTGVTHTEVIEHAGSIAMENVDIVPAKGLKPRNTVTKQK